MHSQLIFLIETLLFYRNFNTNLDSKLIQLLNDKEKFIQFERFLSQAKKFDVDYLHYYVKIMEFKKELNYAKAKLAAGIIIDKYLTEDAENYINMENYVVNQIIEDYEQICQSQSMDFLIFDDSTINIEKSLMRFMDEFKQQR